jgi:parvulin-like peptidyl-prolyl isomerase
MVDEIAGKAAIKDDDSTIQTEEDTIERINEFVTSDESPTEESPVKESMEEEIDTDKEEPEAAKESVVEKKVQQKKEKKAEPKKERPTPAKEEHRMTERPVKKEEHIKIIRKDIQAQEKKEHKMAAKPIIKKIVPRIIIKKEQPAAKKIVHKEPIRHVKKIAQKKAALKIVKNNGDDSMSKKKNPKSSHKMWLWIGVAVVAVILVVALYFIFTPKSGGNPVVTNQTTNAVAATVNGEPIYLQSITDEYNNLNPTVKGLYSIESLLNKSIDELLMSQEAKRLEIQVTADDIQKEIDAIKLQNQLTDATLVQALAQQGMDINTLKTTIEKNLIIRKLLNQTILSNLTVTSTQVENYYNLNIDKFKVPEKVTVQHILILVNANRTENQSKDIILKVQKELNSTNFCDLVTKYSDDTGSTGTCGEYTFGKGEMVQEFETASFNLKVNETTIVKTVYGWHLIKKLEDIPAHTLSLSDVYAQVNTTVYNLAAQERFDVMLAGLRGKASIINYVTKTDNNETSVTTLPKNLDTFAKCITEKGAVFYGASWCQHCQSQKTLFGDSLQYVHYVECADASNPQVQTQECTSAGITGYPTWVINNQSYPGEQTLENLAKLTGCALPQ